MTAEINYLNCGKVGQRGVSGSFSLTTTGTTKKTISIETPFKPSLILITKSVATGYKLEVVYDKSVSESDQTVLEYTNASYARTYAVATTTATGIQSISALGFDFAINNVNYGGTFYWAAIE